MIGKGTHGGQVAFADWNACWKEEREGREKGKREERREKKRKERRERKRKEREEVKIVLLMIACLRGLDQFYWSTGAGKGLKKGREILSFGDRNRWCRGWDVV